MIIHTLIIGNGKEECVPKALTAMIEGLWGKEGFEGMRVVFELPSGVVYEWEGK